MGGGGRPDGSAKQIALLRVVNFKNEKQKTETMKDSRKTLEDHKNQSKCVKTKISKKISNDG